MKPVKLALSLIICLLFAGAVFAMEELKTLPDDPFYQTKRQAETDKLKFSRDPLERAALHAEHAGERLEDVKAMVSKGRHEFTADLLKDYEKSLKMSVDEINKAQTDGRDVSKALSAVEKATMKHTEVLNDLLGKVPEQAKPAIRHAIEVSKHGRNTALDRLERIQRGEIPSGRPKGVERPERPERIERPERPAIPGGFDRPGGFGGHGGGRPGGGPSGGRGGR